MARLKPEINAGSMADIAFLLLIFFLVTATMDVDSGLKRRLPPLPAKEQAATEVSRRNVFEILINSQDELLINGTHGTVEAIRKQVIDFISNPSEDPAKSEKELLSVRKTREAEQGNFAEVEALQKTIDVLGDYPVSQGIISLQNDRGTSYDMYLRVHNELTAAYTHLRDELSRRYFGVAYARLRDKRHIQAVDKAIPMNISEAEPINVGGNK